MHLSPAFLAYKEANLSFYSNYRMSFFKKNTLAMNSQADPFYIIVDKDLDAMVLDFFDNMTKSAYCHPCSSLEKSKSTSTCWKKSPAWLGHRKKACRCATSLFKL